MEDEDIKFTLRVACRRLLRPIASVVMKCGMTWKEFSNLSKSVFVDVASSEFGIRGRPTNVSRVSILTGMSRKEVKRQREYSAGDLPATSTKTTDATRVLSGWYQDPDFLDDEGQPLPLLVKGNGNSFSTLFERYGGDTPRQTLVREMENAGSIRRDRQGRYLPLRRYHMPVAMDVGNLQFFGNNLHDHALTLARNLGGNRRERRFEGFAADDRIHPDAAEAFRQFVDERGQEMLEEIDEWLSRHRADPADKSTIPIRLGLGIYAIEEQQPKGSKP